MTLSAQVARLLSGRDAVHVEVQYAAVKMASDAAEFGPQWWKAYQAFLEAVQELHPVARYAQMWRAYRDQLNLLHAAMTSAPDADEEGPRWRVARRRFEHRLRRAPVLLATFGEFGTAELND
ncbi:hypothetical protein [Nonomuraea sp. NPDC023979]|uniref:hypothetical protein n=1 Tax=Nonomuraea sp. NPDC023979 TaxID=3154796 RepID=UPI0033F84C81